MQLTTQDSRRNKLKRSNERSGQTTVTLGGTVSIPITHNLGYIPFYSYAVTDSNGVLWNGEKVEENTDSSSGFITEPDISVWMTTTSLNFELDDGTGTRRVEWVIYLDYGV